MSTTKKSINFQSGSYVSFDDVADGHGGQEAHGVGHHVGNSHESSCEIGRYVYVVHVDRTELESIYPNGCT
jgi:hypothetical protein